MFVLTEVKLPPPDPTGNVPPTVNKLDCAKARVVDNARSNDVITVEYKNSVLMRRSIKDTGL